MSDPMQEIQTKLTALATACVSRTELNDLAAEVSGLNALRTEVKQLSALERVKIDVEIATLSVRLQELKGTAGRPLDPWIFLKNLAKYTLTYWTLIAFFITALVGGYVYYWYGVGYLEPYKNIAVTKQSADYYLRAGDVLASRAEFGAAALAYKTATEIHPYNIAARRGLILSQVLRSQDGLRTEAPEIIRARLEYLETDEALKDDPLLPYFRGRVASLEGNRKDARKFFENSSKLFDRYNQTHSEQRNFVGNYLELGILDMWEGNITGAIDYFKTPSLANINQTTALNHLAECYLVTDHFNEAYTVLASLYRGAPRLETYLVFADFFRYRFTSDPLNYAQDLESAKTMDRLMADILARALPRADGFKKSDLAGPLDFGRMDFLPIPAAGCPQLLDHSIASAEKLEQYGALNNYSLSLDYALAGDFQEANLYYSQALAADTFNEYRCRFVYMTRYYRSKLSPLDPRLGKWFDAKAETLAPGRCLARSTSKLPDAKHK